MQVHPENNVPELPTTSGQDVPGGGIAIVKTDDNQMTSYELLILTSDDETSHICGEKVKKILLENSRQQNIACLYLSDSENEKMRTKCGRVLFLLKDRNPDVDAKITTWMQALKYNNHNKLMNVFVSLQQGCNSTPASGLEYENDNNSFIVSSFDATLHWWPQFLRNMYGTSEIPQGITARLIDTTTSTNIPLIEFVKAELAAYEDENVSLENIKRIVIFTDNPSKNISPDLKLSLRMSKLNGAHIHLYAVEKVQNLENSLAKGISTKRYVPNSEMIFIFQILLDMGILKARLKPSNNKLLASPGGPLKLKDIKETSAVLVWEQHGNVTDASASVVIRYKTTYEGEWTLVKENLTNSVTEYKVTELNTVKEMYIFSVVNEFDDGVSDPLVSDVCTLMQKQLNWRVWLQMTCIYVLIGLVYILNISQKVLGVVFIISVCATAAGFYFAFKAAKCSFALVKALSSGADSGDEECDLDCFDCFECFGCDFDDDGGCDISDFESSTSDSFSGISSIYTLVCTIVTFVIKTIPDIIKGKGDNWVEYVSIYLPPVVTILIGLIFVLAKNFSGSLLTVIFFVFIFGVGWCIIIHFILVFYYDVKHGVYDVVGILKEHVQGKHPYEFQQSSSTALQAIEVQNI